MATRFAWVSGTEFLRRPSMVGSAFPASTKMVRRILAPLAWASIDIFVEFGPGSGRFTFEILKRLGSDAKLLAIETGATFVRSLRARSDDRRLIIVEGTARDVNHHLATHGLDRADCILTGLPFSTLDPGDADAIMREAAIALTRSGTIAAYQMRTAIRPLLERHFATVRHDYEWWNIPPCHLYWAARPRDARHCHAGGGGVG